MKKTAKEQAKLKELASIYKGVPMPWLLLVIGFAIGLIETHFFTETANLTANIIDGTSQTIKTTLLVRYLLFVLGAGALGVARTWINGVAHQKINLGVRIKLWDKMMLLPMRFYDFEGGETLVSRVTNDADSAHSYFSIVINFVTAVYASIVAAISMFQMNKTMSLYILILAPLLAIGSFFLGRARRAVGYKIKATYARTTGYLAERVRNFKLIKATNMKGNEVAVSDKKLNDQFKADVLDILILSAETTTMLFFSTACLVISFYVGATQVAAGNMTTGAVVAFYTLSSMVLLRFVQVGLYYAQFTEINGILTKVAKLCSAGTEPSGGDELDVFDSDIVLDKVDFSYNGRQQVLSGIRAVFPKGKTTAIIGENGSGKTTIFKLIERMYEPDSGQILFGDSDIRRFGIQSWRKSIAYVTQERALMSGTVRENICYGVERDVSDEELEQVAKMANVYDFVADLPDGFDSEVGPNGSNFSGGQCQCIAIARAIMRNPDYLLLDEATSNLDAKCEQSVSQALDNLMEGRTTLMIAHSLSAIRNADNVVVLRHGEVVASGTPDELIKTSEDYRDFVLNQKPVNA